jgi:hypothetical protein
MKILILVNDRQRRWILGIAVIVETHGRASLHHSVVRFFNLAFFIMNTIR